MSEQKHVLKTSGKIPEITDGKEVHKWMKKLDSIRASINEDNALDKYLYPNGPIAAYGVQRDGYFHVVFYTEKYDVSEEDYKQISEIIKKNKKASGIKDLPIVFTTGTPISLTDDPQIPDIAAGYDNRYRPIVGGILAGFYSPVLDGGHYGTIGFAAERMSDGQKGFVTAGHLVDHDVSNNLDYEAWQPFVSKVSNTNYLSDLDSTSIHTDAAFFEYDNVAPLIHTGNGYGIVVDGYYDYAMSGMLLKKSGSATGLQSGLYYGSYTSQELDTGITVDYCEAMECVSEYGDSGGPVYYTYRNRNKIVGIIMGNNTINGTEITGYIPCSQIKSKLGVEPLEN